MKDLYFDHLFFVYLLKTKGDKPKDLCFHVFVFVHTD